MKHYQITAVFFLVIFHFSANAQIKHQFYLNGGYSWSADIGSAKNTMNELMDVTISDQNSWEFDPIMVKGPAAGIEYAMIFKERWRWESSVSYLNSSGFHQIENSEEKVYYSIEGSSWAIRTGIAYDFIIPQEPSSGISVGIGMGGVLLKPKLDHTLDSE